MGGVPEVDVGAEGGEAADLLAMPRLNLRERQVGGRDRSPEAGDELVDPPLRLHDAFGREHPVVDGPCEKVDRLPLQRRAVADREQVQPRLDAADQLIS